MKKQRPVTGKILDRIMWVTTKPAPEAKNVAGVELGFVDNKVEFECYWTLEDVYVLSAWGPDRMTPLGWFRNKKAAQTFAEMYIYKPVLDPDPDSNPY